MRVGAPEIGAIAFATLRVTIAALVLAPTLLSNESRGQFRRNAFPLLVVGLTNSAIPFSLLAYSSVSVNAGCESILNATMPIWTALIGFVWLRHPMRRDQVAGFALGLVGVLVLSWDMMGAQQLGVPVAVGAITLATICYGFAGNYSKRTLAGVKPLVIAFGSQFYAAIVLLPVAAYAWSPHAVSSIAWLSVLGVGVLCTALALILYFRLIENVSAAFAASVTFIVPLFGVIWGHVFLDERATPLTIIGGVIVLFGTALASGRLAISKRYAVA
jgi:drug/metabolite transporter (DMT)-like permease